MVMCISYVMSKVSGILPIVIVTVPAPQAADLLKDTHPELAKLPEQHLMILAGLCAWP